MRSDIIDEIIESQRRGRDLLRAADGYSYYRLDKPNNRDLKLLVKRLWVQRWRRANPEIAHASDRRKYQRQKADPAQRAKLKAAHDRARAKRKTDPKRRARANELALKYYHQARANPETAAKIRARNRATYERIKADPVRFARRKQNHAAAVRRRRAAKAK